MIGRSHIGLVRKTNEDDFYCDGKERFLVIADGIGGHQYGQIASKIAVNTTCQYIEKHYASLKIEDILSGVFKIANKNVFEYQKSLDEKVTMGTTLTVGIIKDGYLYFGHIGDSRAYILKKDKLPKQITNDHTYLAELAQYDITTYQFLSENNSIDKRNTLVRAIGPDEICEPQFGKIAIENGDYFFMMTDGMYRYLTLQEMVEIIQYTDNLEEVSLRFEQLALERGGKDNLTIVIYRVKGGVFRC